MHKLFIILLIAAFFEVSAMKREKVLQMPSEDAISAWLAHEGFGDFDRVTNISGSLGGDIQSLGNIELTVERKIDQYKKYLMKPNVLELDLEMGTLEMMRSAKGEILAVIIQAESLAN